MSAVFSEPARSMINNSPSSIESKWVFLNLILQMAWEREDVSFLKVEEVALFLAAKSFISRNMLGDVISISLVPWISTFPNLFSPTNTD